MGQPYGVVGELRKHNVDKVLVVSYDLYGVLSQELPALKIANGWGAMSRSKNRRYTFLQLLKTHEGHHVLITKPESLTLYDYFPSSRDIQQMQHLENFKLQQLEAPPHEDKAWAFLFSPLKHDYLKPQDPWKTTGIFTADSRVITE